MAEARHTYVRSLPKNEDNFIPIGCFLHFVKFRPYHEISIIIMSSPNTFCDIDPLTTVLLKAYFHSLHCTITHTIHVPLRTVIC